LNGRIAIELKFGKNDEPSVVVKKQGPSQQALTKKSEDISQFVAEYVYFNYIPAIRTEEDMMNVVSGMLSSALRDLENNKEYSDALEKIAEIQQPVLNSIAKSITYPLQQFLPDIRSVKIDISDGRRRTSLRTSFDVWIDDGVETLIEHKGDGVKSLCALAVLKDKPVSAGASILAIEEPESHLNPDAIRKIRNILEEVSENTQVIISTHSPVLVQRRNVSDNIIVDSGSAKKAKRVRDIRDVIGVRANDNLLNANFCLVVEGEHDVVAVKKLLEHHSPKIKSAMANDTFTVVPAGSASKVEFTVQSYQNMICETYVFLDDDHEGQQAIEQAQARGTIRPDRYNMANRLGCRESEIEDLFDVNLYKTVVENKYSVILGGSFRGKEKFSNRMENCFKKSGKHFDKRTKNEVKREISELAARNPGAALSEHHEPAFLNLVYGLEKMIET